MARTMPLDACGTSVTRHCVVMAGFPRELTDVVMCCTQAIHVSEIGTKCALHDISDESHARFEGDAPLEKMLDPIAGSPATGKCVARIINIFFVDDVFGTGGIEMDQQVLARQRKVFQVGSEDWNDVTFARQRIRCKKDPQTGPCIEDSQEKAIEELEEIPVERITKEDLQCTPAMQKKSRGAFWRKINWLQSKTQFQCCYKFSRCASEEASPTIGDMKALNKLARQLKSQPVKLQFWPLTGQSRIFLDASYRNNEDGSSQRHGSVFVRIA